MDIDYLIDNLNNNILTEINRVRVDPTAYIPILEQAKDRIINNTNAISENNKSENILYYFKTDNNILFEFTENPFELINDLTNYLTKSQKPLNSLTYREDISKCSYEQTKIIINKLLYEINGKNNLEFSSSLELNTRISKFVEWEDYCSESILLNSPLNAKDAILLLLLDDGDFNRSNRKNIFNSLSNYIGISANYYRLNKLGTEFDVFYKPNYKPINSNEYDIVLILNFIGNIRNLNTPSYNIKTFKYKYPKDLKLNTNNVIHYNNFKLNKEGFINDKRSTKNIVKIDEDIELKDYNINEIISKSEIKILDKKLKKVKQKIYTYKNKSEIKIIEEEEI